MPNSTKQFHGTLFVVSFFSDTMQVPVFGWQIVGDIQTFLRQVVRKIKHPQIHTNEHFSVIAVIADCT